LGQFPADCAWLTATILILPLPSVNCFGLTALLVRALLMLVFIIILNHIVGVFVVFQKEVIPIMQNFLTKSKESHTMGVLFGFLDAASPTMRGVAE
jgi:hypothetical protein